MCRYFRLRSLKRRDNRKDLCVDGRTTLIGKRDGAYGLDSSGSDWDRRMDLVDTEINLRDP
jgi:hypothetical protein